MTEKGRIIYIVVGVLVVVTLIHVGVRLFRGERADFTPPGSRGERLETWNGMRRLELTDKNISDFVDAMLLSRTLPAPKGTSVVPFDSVTELQKVDIREALIGFFAAYRGVEPAPVYDYLATSRGPTQLIPDIRKTIQNVAHQSGVTLETEKEVFGYAWDLGSKGIGWEFLLDGSGQSCFWETNAPLSPNQSTQFVLEDPALFGNITTMSHVFTISLKVNESLSRGTKLLFCDAFFVTELNKAKDQDFCAMGIRFWFDDAGKKWVPCTLAFVTPEIRRDIQIPF